MCSPFSRSGGSLFLALLLCLALSLPAYSLTKNPDGSVTLTDQEYQALDSKVKELIHLLDVLKLSPQQQSDKIIQLEKDLSESKAESTQAKTELATVKKDLKESKETIATLQKELQPLKDAWRILGESLESKKTEAIIAWTLFGVSLTGNAVQAIERQLSR